jgi:APA family basic amino acid/polyamine antiporter
MSEPKLRRVVSRWEIVAISINDVIGSGIYLVPAEAAALLGGASVWAVLAAGLAVLMLVLCFAEAGSLFDEPGSAYVYTKAAFGEFIGFEVGWMTWVARVVSVASLSAGFAQAVGFLLPAAHLGMVRVAVIIGMLALLTTINVLGVKQGARAAVVLTIAKVVPLMCFLAVGLFAAKTSMAKAGETLSLDGMRQAALLLLFGYAGFENTAAAAGEFENPRRDVPFALLVQIGTVTAIYTAVQWVAVGVVPNLATSKAPLADGMLLMVGPWGGTLLAVGGLLSVLGTTSNTILAGPRFLYAIAQSGALPAVLTRIHPRFRTPWLSIVIMVAIALPLALTGTFAQLAILSMAARLVTYVGTAASVLVLRKTMAATARTIRLPGGPLIPACAVLVCLLFISAMTWKHLVGGAAALAVGAVLWMLRRPTAA